MVCERCKRQTNRWAMSKFNTDRICMNCREREIQHPLYEKAKAAVNDAVKSGNYFFPGIGKPIDL